jgi:hypothetical protein
MEKNVCTETGTICAASFHASTSESSRSQRFLNVSRSQRPETVMKGFKITLTASIAAFLFGSASVASDLPVGAEISPSHSGINCCADTGRGDPDAPEGYTKLGIAKINGRRVAVYAFENGARLDDAAGEGHGFADVFDSAGHLIRRFAFRENLNSPPRITEYIPIRAD